MAAASLDILIEQGTTFKRTITVKDDANVAIDLTGSTFRGQVRKTPSSPTIVATFTCTLANQITNTGEVEILISAADTSAIPLAPLAKPLITSENFVYNIEWVKPDTSVLRILEGVAVVSPEVTK